MNSDADVTTTISLELSQNVLFHLTVEGKQC